MSTIKADNISPVGSTITLTAPVAGLSVAGGLTVGEIAFFSGGVTFNSTTDHAGVARFASTSTFTGLVTLTGGATSAAVISCGTAPTQGQHLANKTYVDSQLRVGSVVVITATDLSSVWPSIDGSFNNGGIPAGQNTAGLAGVPSSWTVSIVGTSLKVVTNGGTWRGTFIHDNSAGNVAIRYAYQTGTSETIYPTNRGFSLILVRIA